jgi:SAM-dependent methyltransferase
MRAMSKLMEKMVKDGHLGGYIPGGDPGTWCPALWTWAIERFRVRSMLDVGCGEGHSARYFQARGCAVLGVEGCSRALADSVIPGRVAAHDFTRGPFIPPQPFDLVWSCEFLEHVASRYEPNILATFAHAAKVILVTHAFPRQKDGYHHVNCRPSSYWIGRIESLGFTCHVPLTLEARTITLRDFSGVNHFARSGLVFVRSRACTRHDLLGHDHVGHGHIRTKRLVASFASLRLAPQWSPWAKAWRIDLGWRLSYPYRQQRKRQRQIKRDLRRQRECEDS